MTDRPEVIFVGGTRFSGAEPMALRLADEAGGAAILAARFHSDPWGVPALLHGRIGLEDFVERLRSHEIAEQVGREPLDSALGALRSGYEADPLDACRDLFWSLLGELSPDAGVRTLVEASPGNLLEAHTLTRLVPEARFVHVVRDGRDVAADAVDSDAVAVQGISQALEWWAGELREIERGVRGEEDGAPYAIPPERFSVASLDELADIERGRWRSQVRGPARWWTTRRYERTLDELEAQGNHAAPALRAAYDRLS